MRVIFGIVCLLISSLAIGQTPYLSISSPDSIPFQLKINDSLIDSSAQVSHQGIKINEGLNNIITLDTLQEELFNGEMEFPAMTSTSLELVRVKDRFVLVQIYQNTMEEVPLEKPEESRSLEISELQADEVEIEVALTDIEPAYQGPRGCETPCSKGDIEIFKATIENLFFQADRIEAFKDFVSSNCVEVSEVANLMYLIDYDDQKLALCKEFSTQLYDLKNLFILEMVFELSAYRQEWRSFVSSLP